MIAPIGLRILGAHYRCNTRSRQTGAAAAEFQLKPNGPQNRANAASAAFSYMMPPRPYTDRD
jgi:hypothetical protein